jgi:hypothetical protein
MQSPKVIALSGAGVAMALLLSESTMKQQFGILLGLPQLGVLLASCAGGPIWGMIAGVVGGLGLYYGGSGTIWLCVLFVLGLAAGLISYKVRPVAASFLSWATFGVVASYIVYSRQAQPGQAFDAWLMTFSYEVAVSAVVVDVVLALLHVTRIRPKKEAESKGTALRSEAQAEVGF